MHIGVELGDFDVANVAHQDASRRMLPHIPEARSTIIRTGGKVVTKRSKFDIPDWVQVTVIHDQTLARLD